MIQLKCKAVTYLRVNSSFHIIKIGGCVKMKKILLLLLGVLWVPFGCSTNETAETAEVDSNTTENVVSTNENTEMVATEFITHELNQVEYQVADTWTETNSTETIKYYYPDHGMLMSSYLDLEGESLSEESSRSMFIDGFTNGLDDAFNISETKISIDNSDAYRYDMNVRIEEALVDLSLVAFDYKKGAMIFVMYTDSKSGSDYSLDFKKVLDTIELPEDTIVEDEIEIAEYYFDGIDLVAEDFTITVTDYKVLQPGETGNDYGSEPVLAFWFDITVYDHVTNKEYNPNTAWLFSFEAIQDNNPNAINTIRIGSLPDSAHRESQRQTIKPGGTVSSSISYKLSDLETPVTLIAYDSRILGEELGQFDYPVK